MEDNAPIFEVSKVTVPVGMDVSEAERAVDALEERVAALHAQAGKVGEALTKGLEAAEEAAGRLLETLGKMADIRVPEMPEAQEPRREPGGDVEAALDDESRRPVTDQEFQNFRADFERRLDEIATLLGNIDANTEGR